MTLNLKRLNKYVEYKHLKIGSLQNMLQLFTPSVFMISIDLKDAFDAEICMHAKWIWTSYANIHKYMQNCVCLEKEDFCLQSMLMTPTSKEMFLTPLKF